MSEPVFNSETESMYHEAAFDVPLNVCLHKAQIGSRKPGNVRVELIRSDAHIKEVRMHLEVR